MFIYKDLYDSVNKEIKDLKKRHKNEISTGRQNIYTMTKKSLILEIIKSDKIIIDLEKKIQSLEVNKIEINYELIAS